MDRSGVMEPFYPLHAFVCDRCRLVQLPQVVPPEELFTSDYPYFSSYSDSWLRHVQSYADQMVQRFGLGPGSRVVEVASNDGYLLQFFAGKGIPVLGVEPCANVAQAAMRKGVPTIMKFFGSSTARDVVGEHGRANLLVGNNVLAHVPALLDFVAGLKILLAPDGVVTLEFPHLMRLVEGNQFDTIYHEHFSYFSFTTVERIFAAQGLTLFDVEELPTHGGSLRIYGRQAEATRPAVSEAVSRLKRVEEDRGMGEPGYYSDFTERVRETKRRLLEFFIDAQRKGKRICGYAAAGKTNTLLNYCGIRSDMIDFVVDRNPHKQNHLMPGTRIPVYAPEKLDEARPDYLFIGAWNLKDEIMAQTARIRGWGGRWVVPIPEVKVFD
jgi:hypothetical protein